MADPARILLPFEDELVSIPENGDVLYIRPPAFLPSGFSIFKHVICEQGFKPFADRLTLENTTVLPEVTGEYPLVLMALTRSRAENMANFARACRMVSKGGQVVVSGDKTDGIDSVLKAVKKVYEIDGTLSKSHGKVFWLTPATPAPEEWEEAIKPSVNSFGFVTAPGMFSPEKIDVGSEMLTKYFDKSIKGAVADLGSGWGYLSKHVLEKCERLTSLDLYEAEYSALEASKLNITDERASFHWVDVTTMAQPAEPYHTVICNPPFHQGRAAEPAIGISFIATAARIMKPSGQFLMVANRQLPYESAMEMHFKNWEILEQDRAFKIIRARRPLKRQA